MPREDPSAIQFTRSTRAPLETYRIDSERGRRQGICSHDTRKCRAGGIAAAGRVVQRQRVSYRVGRQVQSLAAYPGHRWNGAKLRSTSPPRAIPASPTRLDRTSTAY